MGNYLRLMRKALLIILCSPFIFLVIAGALLFEKSSIVKPYETPGVKATQEAAKFIRREGKKFLSAKSTTEFSIRQEELNNSFHLIQRNHRWLNVQVHIEENAKCMLSVPVSVLNADYFINLSASVVPSDTGFSWYDVSIGRFHFNDGVSNYLFQLSVKLLLGRQFGNGMLNAISDVVTEDAKISFTFNPPADFSDRARASVKRLSHYWGRFIRLEAKSVQYYLDFLVSFTNSFPEQPIALSLVLEQVMLQVPGQVKATNNKLTEESSAALYALAIQTAPWVFKHPLPDIDTSRLSASHKPTFILHGRQDLALHFIYSAAIKILSNRGISFSVGEAKEILDITGSGFSFMDIAADKAGIRFAELCLDDEKSAGRLIEFIESGLREQDMFPKRLMLPEGLNEDQFQLYFDNVDSDQYKAFLQVIDESIDNLKVVNYVRNSRT